MSTHGAGVAQRVQARLLDQPTALPALERVAHLVRDEVPLLGAAACERLVADVVATISGLGPLEPLLAAPAVTEVMVNGPGRVWVERAGALERVEMALDERAIEHLIEKIVSPLGLRADRAAPIVDARLPDGSRVNAVVPPLAIDGRCLTIRRFGAVAVPLAAFCAAGVAALLRWAVGARLNLLVSGGMGAVALPLAAVREQVLSSLDLVVQVSRMAGGRRVVTEVAEVVDGEGGSRTRALGGTGGLEALPSRPPRLAGAPQASGSWLER